MKINAKKIISLILASFMLLIPVSLASCADNNGGAGTDTVADTVPDTAPETAPETEPYDPTIDLSSTLEEIMKKIYENAGFKDLAVMNIAITEENSSYYIGVENGKATLGYEEALASDAMMSSQAHSVVLVRMPVGGDVETAKKAIKENADPWKWVCAWVDDKDVIVDNIGNLIILVMTNFKHTEIYQGFLDLAG